MGTQDGQIYYFDPILRGKLDIKRYNYEFEKRKSIDLVKWLTPSPKSLSSSKFVVVFADGSLALYHKDKDVSQSKDYDIEKDLLKVSPEQTVSKATILKRMINFV